MPPPQYRAKARLGEGHIALSSNTGIHPGWFGGGGKNRAPGCRVAFLK